MSQLRNIIYVILGIFCLSLSAQAKLKWDSKLKELFPSLLDKKVVANYAFENVGEEPVKIMSVKPSCGCTTAELEKRIYQPGETGVINTTFELGEQSGLQMKAILVTTEGSELQPEILELLVHIPELVEVEPDFAQWWPNEEKEKKTITLTASHIDTFQITKVESQNPQFKATLEVLDPGKNYQISVTPPDAIPNATGTLRIFTDIPSETGPVKFTIPVGVGLPDGVPILDLTEGIQGKAGSHIEGQPGRQ